MPTEPPAHWLPLSKAILRLGIGQRSPVSRTDHAGSEADTPWYLDRLNRDALALQPLDLADFTEQLEKLSGAKEAKIDPDNASFTFFFHTPGSGVSFMTIPPWESTEPSENLSPSDPRLDAEALFNKEGIVRISEEDAARYAAQEKAAQRATSIVWQQIQTCFDRAISSGRILLHARIGTVTADFAGLPRDIWAIVRVVDWDDGIAVAPDGTQYWSIHVESTDADPEQEAAEFLSARLKSDPDMKRADAARACKEAGHRLGQVAFDRVWKAARASAGLPLKAKAGRKRKKSLCDSASAR